MSVGSALAESGLLETFQHHIEDIRSLIHCGICVKPLYEPFTLACGHTFCYGCLTEWFMNHQRAKTCPDCRSPVKAEPAPAYLLRNIIRVFISRPELLEDGESTAEHLATQQVETEKIEEDKRNTDPSCGGLFKGCFKRVAAGPPIQDSEDGVERCPACTWELEEGECLHCGFTLDAISGFGSFGSDVSESRSRSRSITILDSDVDIMPRHEHFSHGWRDQFFGTFDRMDAGFSGHGFDDFSEERSIDDDSDDDMGSFIEDDMEQATVVADHDSVTGDSVRSARGSPFYHPDDTHDTSSVIGPIDNGRNRLELTIASSDNDPSSRSSSDSDSSGSGSGSEDDDPIRAPVRPARISGSESEDDDHIRAPVRPTLLFGSESEDDDHIRAPVRSARLSRPSGPQANSSCYPYSINSSRNRRFQREASGSTSRDAISLDSDDSEEGPRQCTRRRPASREQEVISHIRRHRRF